MQNVEAWEWLYHEPLVHLPMAFLRNAKSALIAGGGTLNALRELAKYSEIRRIILVEIDRDVLEATLSVSPALRGLCHDPRVTVIHGNAYEFIKATSEHFDVIINDACDLTVIPGAKGIIRTLYAHLTTIGVCADVVYRHTAETNCTLRMLELTAFCAQRAVALIFVPEYPGTLHFLVMWGKNAALHQGIRSTRNLEQQRWVANDHSPCLYYEPKNLRYFLHIPQYLQRIFGKHLPSLVKRTAE